MKTIILVISTVVSPTEVLLASFSFRIHYTELGIYLVHRRTMQPVDTFTSSSPSPHDSPYPIPQIRSTPRPHHPPPPNPSKTHPRRHRRPSRHINPQPLHQPPALLRLRKSPRRRRSTLSQMHKKLTNTAPIDRHMQRLSHLKLLTIDVRLYLRALDRAVAVRLQSGKDGGEVREGWVASPEIEDVGEGIWVGGVVGVAYEVAGVEFSLVLEDGGFELPELVEDEVALFAALELDAVDCGLGFDGWVVGAAERAVEEGV